VSEQKPATAPPITDAQWDDLAVRCGNCQLEIIARNGEIPGNNGLSDTGNSEDEALCGRCAGAEMYRLMDEADKRDAQPAPRISAEALAETDAFERWASEHYNLSKHPLHYLLLDEKTYHARQGWKAALQWAQQPEEKRNG
jgi:hypothetical protein